MENGVTEVTSTGERIVYSTKRHWAILIPPFFLLVFGGLSIPSKGNQAWVLIAISLVWMVLSWMNFQTAWFRLTRDRLLVKIGFPFPGIRDIPLESIRTANIYQPVLGKFLDFGKVRIICNDGSKRFYKMVRSPQLLLEAIYEYKVVPGETTGTETPDKRAGS